MAKFTLRIACEVDGETDDHELPITVEAKSLLHALALVTAGIQVAAMQCASITAKVTCEHCGGADGVLHDKGCPNG